MHVLNGNQNRKISVELMRVFPRINYAIHHECLIILNKVEPLNLKHYLRTLFGICLSIQQLFMMV